MLLFSIRLLLFILIQWRRTHTLLPHVRIVVDMCYTYYVVVWQLARLLATRRTQWWWWVWEKRIKITSILWYVVLKHLIQYIWLNGCNKCTHTAHIRTHFSPILHCVCSPACLPAVSHSLHSLWPFFGMSDCIMYVLCERLRLCGDFHINLIICTDEWIQCTLAHTKYREINQMICVMLLMPLPTKCKRAHTHAHTFHCCIMSEEGEKVRVRVGA